MVYHSLKLAFLRFWPPLKSSNSGSHRYSPSSSDCPVSEFPVIYSRLRPPVRFASCKSGRCLFLCTFREGSAWSWKLDLRLCGECFHDLTSQMLVLCFRQILAWSRLLCFLVSCGLFFHPSLRLFAGNLLSWRLQCKVHWAYIRRPQPTLRICYFLCSSMRRMRDWRASLFKRFPCR